MDDLRKIVLTSSPTLCGGIAVFCATTILNKLIFESVVALRKALGEVSFCLQCHAWVIHGGAAVDRERRTTVFDEPRIATARMSAEAAGVIGYPFFASIGLVPPYQDLIQGAGRLIRISNLVGGDKWDLLWEDMRAAEKLLRIDTARPKYVRQPLDRDRKAPGFCDTAPGSG